MLFDFNEDIIMSSLAIESLGVRFDLFPNLEGPSVKVRVVWEPARNIIFQFVTGG